MDLSSSIEKGVSFEFGKVPTEPSADAMLYVFLSVMARPSVPREHRKSLRIIGRSKQNGDSSQSTCEPEESALTVLSGMASSV
jgi:hypothetical protein